MNLVRDILGENQRLNIMYIGSQHSFSAKMFHQLCDDKGATISICKSEHNHIFGFYTDVPWKYDGGFKSQEGRAFLFKFQDEEVVIIEQKNNEACVWYRPHYLIADG